MVLAFTTVSAVLGASTLRGIAACSSASFLGLMGIDTQTGQARFTLGIPELLDGIDVVIVAVGPVRGGRDALRRDVSQSHQVDKLEKIRGLDHG